MHVWAPGFSHNSSLPEIRSVERRLFLMALPLPMSMYGPVILTSTQSLKDSLAEAGFLQNSDH